MAAAEKGRKEGIEDASEQEVTVKLNIEGADEGIKVLSPSS